VGLQEADRTLQFRRANRLFNESWGKIETETLFPDRWGTLPQKTVLADLSASNKLNAETIDLPELSKDSRKFADFVEGQQQIVLASSSVATIPTRREVAVALMNGTYEKYNPADFVGLKFGLYNEIRSESHYPFSFFTGELSRKRKRKLLFLLKR
jgi:hypothetical protein